MITNTENIIKIVPTPHFVVKTRLLQPSSTLNYAPGTKLFINVCSSTEVPRPPTPFTPPQTYELIMADQWEVPIVTSSHRVDVDKKGEKCLVFDCVVNSDAMRWCQQDRQLREIVMEWCLESVEVTGECVLDREKMTVPKMVSKGQPGVVEWVKDEKRGGESVDAGVNDVSELLQMKRIVEDESMEIDILGSSKTQGKSPLIQEIQDMSLESKKPSVDSQSIRAQVEVEKLNYTTSMKKIDLNGYKLEIDITSQNSSSLDYDLSLDANTNTLVLKNTNSKYSARDLQLPLPTIFDQPQIKTFFVAPQKKLVIFVR